MPKYLEFRQHPIGVFIFMVVPAAITVLYLSHLPWLAIVIFELIAITNTTANLIVSGIDYDKFLDQVYKQYDEDIEGLEDQAQIDEKGKERDQKVSHYQPSLRSQLLKDTGSVLVIVVATFIAIQLPLYWALQLIIGIVVLFALWLLNDSPSNWILNKQTKKIAAKEEQRKILEAEYDRLDQIARDIYNEMINADLTRHLELHPQWEAATANANKAWEAIMDLDNQPL
jgi:hypothetical protein